MTQIVFRTFLILIALIFQSVSANANDGKWISLFNGENLDGWTPKFVGHQAGVNYKDTFIVKHGIFIVSYDNYDKFDRNFGHIFYKQKFSHYILKLEYRMRGNQTPGGPSWGIRNNGIMVHSQSAESMEIDQLFPRSIEVQLLNGTATGETTNGNLCTPGTHVEIGGELITQHCVNSNSMTNRGEDWIKVEVEVRGNQVIRHKINDIQVMEYQHPQIDAMDDETPVKDLPHLTPLTEGYIALQAESHPTEFRNIMLLNLEEK